MSGILGPRMPAEWEPHEATWIAWPHEESDFPGKLFAVEWCYTEIVRVLSESERVELLVRDAAHSQRVQEMLAKTRVAASSCRLHMLDTDRSWLRDSAPTGVIGEDGTRAWVEWSFNAWAKYDNYRRDRGVPAYIAKQTNRPAIRAERPDGSGPLVLEGGAIDTDGRGTLLVTEECLLSEVQERNPGLRREQYERAFADLLGIRKTIWLDRGVAGDDTHGHIDDIARFVAPGKVALAYEDDPARDFHQASVENWQRLCAATDAQGRPLEVVKLPMPRRIDFGDERLPASYANFYIANSVVLVPTFNDEQDRNALDILAALFPTRKVVGIHSVELVLGQGTLHCLTQQQPA